MSNGGRRHVSHSRYTNRPQTLHTRLWRGPIGPAKHACAAREAVKCCWWAQAPSGCNGALVQGRNQFFDAWACQVRYVIDRDVCKPTSDSNT